MCAGLTDIMMNALAVVDAVAIFKGLLEVDQQRLVGQSPYRFGTGLPSVIAATMNFEYHHRMIEEEFILGTPISNWNHNLITCR